MNPRPHQPLSFLLAAPKSHKTAEQVDGTGLLVREFNPSQKQLKVIEGITAKPPVPLDQIDKPGHK